MTMPACTVGLDLRTPGRAAAVAIDRTGRVRAWALVFDDGDRETLARLALEELSVRPKALRVLLGSNEAQVGAFTGAAAPHTPQITETLLAEGHEPVLTPAVAAVSAAPGTWLVAACDEELVGPLAERLSGLVSAEPTFVVDQLLLAQSLEPGSVGVESAEIGLLIVAMPWDSTPIARLLPVADHAERAPGEIRRTLGDQGVEDSVWVLGPQREELSSRLAADGFEVREETMPTCGSETLPADVELALRLAEAEEVAALSGPRLDKRHRSMRWAQRVAWAGIALALLGAFLVVGGSAALWRNRARQDALRAEAPGVGKQIRQLQEIVALAEEVRRLHAEVAAHGLPWPRLAPPVAGLAQQRPPGVGWERLEIAGGKLELQVSASGPKPFYQLELVRSALESSPGLVNVAWDEPAADAPGFGVRQTFRARVREARPGGGEAVP